MYINFQRIKVKGAVSHPYSFYIVGKNIQCVLKHKHVRGCFLGGMGGGGVGGIESTVQFLYEVSNTAFKHSEKTNQQTKLISTTPLRLLKLSQSMIRNCRRYQNSKQLNC